MHHDKQGSVRTKHLLIAASLLVNHHASSAGPTTATLAAWATIGIFIDVRVAIGAMRFRQLSPRCRQAGVSSPDVHLASHGFKVAWVHTAPHPAFVVDLQPIGNRSDKQFIGYSMSEFLFPSAAGDITVTADRIISTEPQEAPGVRFRDVLGFKTVKQRAHRRYNFCVCDGFP